MNLLCWSATESDEVYAQIIKDVDASIASFKEAG